MPVATAWKNLQYDSFPILSTLMLRAWDSVAGRDERAAARAGETASLRDAIQKTDRVLRIYGFIIGLFSLAAVWVTCLLLGGRGSPPLLALALVGMAPWPILAIDSIRPYGVGIVLIVLTAGFMWRVVSSSTWRNIAIAGLLAILSVQAMYQNAFLLLGICVAGAVVAWRQSNVRAVITVLSIGAAAALSLTIYAPSLAAAGTWNGLVQRATPITYLFTVFSQAATPEGAALDARIFLAIWIALALVCAIAAFQRLRPRRTKRVDAANPDAVLYGGVLVVAASVFYFVGLLAARIRTEPWYYVPLMALIAPAIDVVSTAIGGKTARKVIRLVLAIGIAGITLNPASVQLSKRRTTMDQAALLASQGADPGDLVVVFPFFFGVSFQRYYHGAAPWTSVPPIAELRIHRYDLLKAQMLRPAEAIAPVLAQMAETMKSGHRLWIVGVLPTPDRGMTPQSPAPAPAPGSGWNCGPYNHVWGQQVAAFLESHATRGRVAQGLSDGKVNPFEDVPVAVPSGWREATAR